MSALAKWLSSKGAPMPVIADIGEHRMQTDETLTKLHLLAGTLVGLETLLEYHGLLSPEIMEAVRPIMLAKLREKGLIPPEETNAPSPEEGCNNNEPHSGDPCTVCGKGA